MISKQKIASQEVRKCFVSQITDLSVLRNELCVALTATVFNLFVHICKSFPYIFPSQESRNFCSKETELITGYFMAENLLLTQHLRLAPWRE